MSKFKKFQDKLQREGYSRDSAQRIAAAEGAKAHGWEWMSKKAAEARKRNKEHHA
jgi:hypothetical protein